MYRNIDRPNTPVKYHGHSKTAINHRPNTHTNTLTNTLAVWNNSQDNKHNDPDFSGDEPTKDNVHDFGPDTSIHFEESIVQSDQDIPQNQHQNQYQNDSIEVSNTNSRGFGIHYQELNEHQFEYLLCKSPVSLIGSSSSSTSSLQNAHLTSPAPDFRDLGLPPSIEDTGKPGKAGNPGSSASRHSMNTSQNSSRGGQGRSQAFSPPPGQPQQNGRPPQHVTSPTPFERRGLDDDDDEDYPNEGPLSDDIKVMMIFEFYLI
jgi:hypothetical protein